MISTKILLLALTVIAAEGDDDPLNFRRSLLDDELFEHNLFSVPVTKVHMVVSSHFDAGCKTPSCGINQLGEQDYCANVGVGKHAHGATNPTETGEPFAYHIINRYFDIFIPRAIKLAALSTAARPYRYMMQPWIADFYLDCENAGLTTWPNMPLPTVVGMPLLHCPSHENQTAFLDAIKRGDIFLHAFPHDGEASYYPDASIFRAALDMGVRVASAAGVPTPTVVSQRDVPGWTRAALPHLVDYGIVGLSFGAGTPPGKPDVPPLFLWRDEASGAEVVTTYETAYGSVATVFVLPTGEALAVAWAGDNTGPPSASTVDGMYDSLLKKYPGAEVRASTFDAFFAAASVPAVKQQLPVVTSEIGDGWIYGVPSDPLKNAQFRALARIRLQCVQRGECDPSSPGMRAFDRLLVKVPEHTWGVAQGWFLPDYANWTNAQFDIARAQMPLGFIRNNTLHADYNTTTNSWVEQRLYVTSAPALIKEEHPSVALAMEQALEDLAVVVPHPNTTFAPVPKSEWGEPFTCGTWELAFDCHGRISHLLDSSASDVSPWANATHTLGGVLYQTFTDADYDEFLWDFASRLGDTGIWPNHTESRNGCRMGSASACNNFRKPNMSSAAPVHRALLPALFSLAQEESKNTSRCRFLLRAKYPADAHELAGAPVAVSILLTVTARSLEWDVISENKRPTRLAESLFFSLVPAVGPIGWSLQILNNTMDPLDVVGKLGVDDYTTVYGGSPHLHGIEEVSWKGATSGLTATSLDVPVVSLGVASPFPTPRTGPPDMAQGVHFNIYNNIWNTNYVLWYPFAEADRHIRSRFLLQVYH